MGALMDATACRVRRPREDAARGEWRDGEGRRTLPTLAFAPETFCPIPSVPVVFYSRRPPLFPSSSTAVVRLCSRRLLRPSSASVPVVFYDRRPPLSSSSSTAVVRLCPRRLLRPSSASVPVVYSISGRPSPFSTFSPPLSRAVSLPPPIVLTGHRSHPFPDIFNRLLLSSGSPIVFSVHHPHPVPLLSQHLLHSRSDLPIILSSPRQSSPASVPALSLSSSPLPTTVLDSDAIFSIPDRHHHFPHHRSHLVPLIFQHLLLSSESPIVFSVHCLPPVPLPSQHLLHSRSDLPIVLASHRPP